MLSNRHVDLVRHPYAEFVEHTPICRTTDAPRETQKLLIRSCEKWNRSARNGSLEACPIRTTEVAGHWERAVSVHNDKNCRRSIRAPERKRGNEIAHPLKPATRERAGTVINVWIDVDDF